jgi:copper(I)-binding protein
MKPPILAALALVGLAATAAAHDVRQGALTISNAWSRPTPPGAPTAVGYLTIANNSGEPDRLIGADTPAAASLGLHSMSNAGGIMRMRAVPEGLTIAPHAAVTLNPDGYHLMFEGLKGAFKPGDHVPAVLHFEHAGAVRIRFEVGEGPRADPMAGMAMH